MRAVKWRTLLRSYNSILRSPSWTWRAFCQPTAAPPPVVQLPESSKERVLQLIDHYQSESERHGRSIFTRSLDKVRNWALENNAQPHPKVLEIMFSMCLRSDLGSDVDIALTYAAMHDVKLSDGQINALMSWMARLGDYAKTKQIVKKMEKSGIELRLSALCTLMQQAATERDFPYLLGLSKQLRRHKSSLHTMELFEETLKHVFRASAGSDDQTALEIGRELVDTFRIMRQKLRREMANVISEWFGR